MSSRDDLHDRLEELIAAEVLDGLSDDDRTQLDRELDAHGSDCEICAGLRVGHAETAAALALMLEPVGVSAEAEDRLVAAARALGPAPSASRPSAATPADAERARQRRPSRVAALAVAAAVAAAGFGGYLLRGAPTTQPEAFAAYRSAPTTQVLELSGTGDGRLSVYYRPGEQGGWVAGSNLPVPSDGRVYELWYLPPGETAMSPAGTFVPSGDTFAVPVGLGSTVKTVAVSIEPGFETSPTGPVVFSGNLVPEQ